VTGRTAILLALLLAACVTIGPPAPVSSIPVDREAALGAYARVLEGFVDERGRVDFVALSRDRADLDAYVRFVAETPLDAFAPGDERLAHLIDSYNALSMFNVIESAIPESHAGLRKVRFFVLRKFVIGGHPMSLYAYEDEVIRAQGDARVHFALNCSALGCPVLPRRPFSSGDLQRTLERETRRFFSTADHLRVDDERGVVHVSELLRFYSGDFGPDEAARIAFVSRYAPRPVPAGYEVRYIPFDWTVAASGPLRRPGTSGPDGM
jgi:hypothetical protein